jgi:SAM-dependent methyltransferase
VPLPISCPLCGSESPFQSVVTRHVYGDATGERAFFHCARCDVRYLFPGLSAEQEARFYASEFESFMASRAGAVGGWDKVEDHVRANESTRLRRLAYLRPHLPQAINILEVGCSSGFMLWPFCAEGRRCVGIEPSGAFGDYLRSRGLEIYNSLEQLANSATERRFDLIMHFFVLEHISSPVPFLQRLIELLNPGGRMVFEIPNAADPLHSVYAIPEFERFYWSIAHPWYFSESSLGHLLEGTGKPYSIQREQRYDLSNHLIWARDGRPGGMGRFSSVFGPELEETYRRALVAAGHCDTLVGVVEKG